MDNQKIIEMLQDILNAVNEEIPNLTVEVDIEWDTSEDMHEKWGYNDGLWRAKETFEETIWTYQQKLREQM